MFGTSSSSIAIPSRKRDHAQAPHESAASSSRAAYSVSSSSSSSYASSAGFGTSAHGKLASSSNELPKRRPIERRPSLLSSSLSRVEHTVVDVGTADCPRLITCVKASQGYEWNQEIFLPSYMDHSCEDLEHRQDPVKEIHVTDEEIARMFPS